MSNKRIIFITFIHTLMSNKNSFHSNYRLIQLSDFIQCIIRNSFKLLVSLCCLLFICSCNVSDPVGPFDNIEGPYDCKCEKWYRELNWVTGEWMETRDTVFSTDTLIVIDSMTIGFRDRTFECDLLASTGECENIDFSYMLFVPSVHLYFNEGRLVYEASINSQGPAYGHITCECFRQQ